MEGGAVMKLVSRLWSRGSHGKPEAADEMETGGRVSSVRLQYGTFLGLAGRPKEWQAKQLGFLFFPDGLAFLGFGNFLASFGVSFLVTTPISFMTRRAHVGL